jgi:hypothetical protein
VRLRSAAIAAAVLLAVSVCACDSGASSRPPVPTTPVGQLPVSTGSHVVMILMENKERGSVIGSPKAPYINALARRYAAPPNFYGVSHPSLPNYLALIGGSTFGVRSDCTGCQQRATNLVDQFEAAGVSWKGYMEGMPRPCFKGGYSGRYAKKHNPFAYFDDIVGDPARCQKIVPATLLRGDLKSGRLPDFVWISPDLCNDMHDCTVAHGDHYLAGLVPPLLREIGPHGLLILTFDEGSSNASCCGGLARGGRIPTVIAGPDVKRGARPGTAYSHYSTLRTVEDAFGLPHLRNAGASATKPLDAAFKAKPRFR